MPWGPHSSTSRVSYEVKEVRHRKTNTTQCHLYVGSEKQKETNEENKTHRHREQVGSCQRGVGGGGLGELGERIKRHQLPVTKSVSHRDGMCSAVTTVNNTVLHI